jgi:hypothetical protein
MTGRCEGKIKESVGFINFEHGDEEWAPDTICDAGALS